MRIKINGKVWDLVFEPQSRLKNRFGDCDDPKTPNKKIRIRANLKGELELDTIIHELLHAGFWQIDEDVINTISSDMARVLTRLGYKK